MSEIENLEITSVEISDECLKSYPCQHSVIVHRGPYSSRIFTNGRSITRDYWNFLTEKDKKHFREYLVTNILT
jgi:hypothetical protein